MKETPHIPCQDDEEDRRARQQARMAALEQTKGIAKKQDKEERKCKIKENHKRS